jgi:hypothetical protein
MAPTATEELERRRAQARTDLLRAGYSTAMAGALSRIDDAELRDGIRRVIGRVGVKDGPIRVYAVKLLANRLGVGPIPTCPASAASVEELVKDRTLELARELRPPKPGD